MTSSYAIMNVLSTGCITAIYLLSLYIIGTKSGYWSVPQECSAGHYTYYPDSCTQSPQSLYRPDVHTITEVNDVKINQTATLKCLYLENQNITLLQDKAFEHLPLLEAVILCSSGIATIDGLAFYNTSLTHLYLARNQLTSMPNLTDIKPVIEILDLSHNQISSIEACEFVGYKMLYIIYLNNNRLTKLADLSVLPWRSNGYFPGRQYRMNSMMVNASSNLITNVEFCTEREAPVKNCSVLCDQFGYYNTRVVYLQNNSMIQISNSSLKYVPGLILYISNLNFSSECDLLEFEMLFGISQMYTSNMLNEIPDLRPALQGVQCRCGYNSLFLSFQFQSSNLNPFRLCGNFEYNISALVDTNIMLGFPSSEFMNVPNISIFQEIITYLNLFNNFISFVPKDYISEMTNLEYLSLSNNRLTTFPDISNNPNLLTLIVRWNLISNPIFSVSNMSNLQRLYAENNQLETLPIPTYPLRHLRYVILDDNFIKEVNNNLICFLSPYTAESSYDVFSITNNRLESLPDLSSLGKPFPKVYADGNPLVCNCSLAHTFRYEHSNLVKSTKHSYIYTGAHQCPNNSDPLFIGKTWNKDIVNASFPQCFQQTASNSTNLTLDCEQVYQEARRLYEASQTTGYGVTTTLEYSPLVTSMQTASASSTTNGMNKKTSEPTVTTKPSPSAYNVDVTFSEQSTTIGEESQTAVEIDSTTHEANNADVTLSEQSTTIGEESGTTVKLDSTTYEANNADVTFNELRTTNRKESRTTVNLDSTTHEDYSEEKQVLMGKCKKITSHPPVTIWRKRIRTDHLGGLIIRNVIKDTKFDCLDVCLKSWCCSFYFNPNNGSCLTHQADTAEWLLTKDAGWKFFTLIKGKTRQ